MYRPCIGKSEVVDATNFVRKSLRIVRVRARLCAAGRVFDASLGKFIVNRNELIASNIYLRPPVAEQVRIRTHQRVPFSYKHVPGHFSSIVPILSVFY